MPKSHNIATPAKEHCTISELIARPDVFIFEDKETGKAALFSRQAGPALAVRNLSGDELSTLIAGGDIAQICRATPRNQQRHQKRLDARRKRRRGAAQNRCRQRAMSSLNRMRSRSPLRSISENRRSAGYRSGAIKRDDHSFPMSR